MLVTLYGLRSRHGLWHNLEYERTTLQLLLVSEVLVLLTAHSGPGSSQVPRPRLDPRPATSMLWGQGCAGGMFRPPVDSDWNLLHQILGGVLGFPWWVRDHAPSGLVVTGDRPLRADSEGEDRLLGMLVEPRLP